MPRIKSIYRGFVVGILALLTEAALLSNCNAQVADVPSSMNTFRLDGSTLLKGFVASKSVSNVFGSFFERPPYATGVLNARYFHGPSELRYSVLLFPNQNALEAWNKQMSNTAPGWLSPLHSPKDKHGVQQTVLGGERRIPRSTALVVNRVLIAVYPYQHGTAAKGTLPSSEFVSLVEKVKEELIVRAKRLPSNKD